MSGSQTEKGQVMLLTVLLTGGVLLAATAVAGLMMVYQIRQTTAVIDSVQAIFAADAAVEWELFCRAVQIKDGETQISGAPCLNYYNYEILPMSNGSVADIKHIGESVRVKGVSNQASRAFELNFEE